MKPKKYCEKLLIRLNPEQKRVLEHLVEETGMSSAEIIRYLIDEKIKNYKL